MTSSKWRAVRSMMSRWPLVTGSNEPGQRAVATRWCSWSRRVRRSRRSGAYPRTPASIRRSSPAGSTGGDVTAGLDHHGRGRRRAAPGRGERRRGPRRARRRRGRRAGRGTRGRTAPRPARAAAPRNEADRAHRTTCARSANPVRGEVGCGARRAARRSLSTNTARAAPRDSASIAERAAPRVQVEHRRALEPRRPERREQRLLHPVGRSGRASALRRDQPPPAGLTRDRPARCHALRRVAHQLLKRNSTASPRRSSTSSRSCACAVEVGIVVEHAPRRPRAPRSRSARPAGAARA